ncbi:MAG: diphthine--ammonia ligase [Candidatus Diapherotrites archaeon]|nr:diphthine--ammonia ligase [Candidatus Diapherotrites archaeon]
MKLCALFSGGKDSTYAVYKMQNRGYTVDCLLSIKGVKDSYMFHVPNIDLTKKLAESMNKKIYFIETNKGKEEELEPLKEALKKIKKERKIEGIITGAIASKYQSERIQKIADELGLKCFNPLWGINQIKLLEELIENKFEVIIVGFASAGFNESWLGKKIDLKTIQELIKLEEKYQLNPAGEGGEIETLVTDCPLFEKKMKIIKANKKVNGLQGFYEITESEMEEK